MIPYRDKRPALAKGCHIAKGAVLAGDVTLGENVSIWHNAVLRGDTDLIRVGAGSNIQDNATLHCTAGKPVLIGENVTVGHNAIIHGATVADNVLVGMGAILLDNAVIGQNSIIGAGALVPEGKVIPANSLVIGVPGKIVRDTTAEEAVAIADSAVRYVALAKAYRDPKEEKKV